METNQIALKNLKSLRSVFILLVLTCCYTNLFAQWPAEYKTRDSLIEKSIAYLQQKGVDTIAIYSQHSYPNLLPNCRYDQFPNYDANKYDPCISKETFMVFVLWKKAGQTFFTFKTSCYDYPDKPLKDNGLWDYYIKNRTAIENSKPKEPLLKHVNLQTEEVTTAEDKIDYKEAKNNQFIIIMKNNKTIKNIGYRLYERFSNMGDQNLNYEYNINLPDKQLQIKLETICWPVVISKELTAAATIK